MKVLCISCIVFLVSLLACDPRGSSANGEMPDAPFHNSRWVLRELQGLSSVRAPNEAYIQFPADQANLHGTAGCNNFFGSFEVNGQSLRLGPLGATKMLCEDMTVEDALLPILATVERYEIAGNFMTLYDAEGQVVRLEAILD